MNINKDNSKDKSKDEKVAVAGSIAIIVVVILLVGWSFFFLKKITRGEDVKVPFGGIRKDMINFNTPGEAIDSVSNAYHDASEELRRIRDEAAQRKIDLTTDDGNNPDTFFDADTNADKGFGF